MTVLSACFVMSGVANASEVDRSSGGGGGGSLTWSIVITPKEAGSVSWKTTSPPASGTFTASDKITFNPGSYIDLTFQPKAGYKLLGVLKNLEKVTLDAQQHARFGPVDGKHTILAVFSEIIPLGTFPFSFPDKSENLASVFDVTGSYKGTVPILKTPRDYSVDIAMDEFGKVSALGRVRGIENNPDAAKKLETSTGSIKTVDNKATGMFKGKFDGTVDGVASSASGSATGPVEPQSIGGTAMGIGGTISYKGKFGDVPYSDKNLAFQVPIAQSQLTNIKKAWSIKVTVRSEIVKGKEVLMGSSVLTLPNGDVIAFLEKKTKYSAKKGYSLSFKGGMNLSVIPTAPDKSSSVAIKGMTLVQSGGTWIVSGGTIAYKFLGQKGQGNLAEFKMN